jgi:hypothetical protein
MKVGVLLSTGFFALALLGCRDRSSEQRLVDMAVKVQDNSAKIQELSIALDGMSARLGAIENSLQELSRASSQVEKPASGSAGDSTEGSADMESISRQVAFLMEELAATKEELATTKGGLEKIGVELSKPRDIGEALFKIAGDPDVFVPGLDRLLGTVSSRIEDAVTRQNFETEMAQLRDAVLTPPSPDELYQELRARHIEKLDSVTDEKDRRAVEQAITRLENCGEEELQKRLTQYARERTLGEFFRIAKTYGVQKEDLIETWFARPDKE